MANKGVYEKPKQEFQVSFEEQAKKKKKRTIWQGQVPEHQVQSSSSDDDNIFQIEQKNINQIKTEENQNENENIEDEDMKEAQLRLKERRRIIQSQMIDEFDQEPTNVEAPDEEQLIRRRKQILQNRLEKEDIEVKKEEQIQSRRKQESSSEENEEEYEDDYEEEGTNEKQQLQLKKPVFVNRKERDKLTKQQEEEIRLREENEKILSRKKFENKMLILQTIQAENDLVRKEDDQLSDGKEILPNDDDDQDEKSYALWKIRELKRLKRDYYERTKYEREKAEIERRRRMTDAERIEEDFRLGSQKTQMQEKTKYVFMQKYYHKGAYYQDQEDEIFQRDYNLPVGEDLWDKSKLPQILQQRRGQFGKKGKSKYTHLTDQDTTDYNPEYQTDENIRMRNFMKQAGNWGANSFSSFYKK